MSKRMFGTKILNYIRRLDLYGTYSKIGIGGQESSNSILGSLITIASIFYCFYLTLDDITNMKYRENPTISTDVGFDNEVLYLDGTNFDFNIAFYKHNNQSKDEEMLAKANSYNYVSKIYDLYYSCSNCTGQQVQEYTINYYNTTEDSKCTIKNCSQIQTIFITKELNQDLNSTDIPFDTLVINIQSSIKNEMVFSNNTKFNKLSINSFSENRAQQIINIFNNYYFTFSNNFSFVLNESDTISTKIYIPINNNSINKSKKKLGQNNERKKIRNVNQTEILIKLNGDPSDFEKPVKVTNNDVRELQQQNYTKNCKYKQ